LKKNATLVYLEDAFKNIEAKLTGGLDRGIVGLKSKTLRQIYDERKPLYARYADITVNCHGKAQDEVVAQILGIYRAPHKSR
jgi:shikimate kinase